MSQGLQPCNADRLQPHPTHTHSALLHPAPQAIKFLQQAVGLRGYAARDPLTEFKLEGYQLFLETTAQVWGLTHATSMPVCMSCWCTLQHEGGGGKGRPPLSTPMLAFGEAGAPAGKACMRFHTPHCLACLCNCLPESL